MPDRERQGRLVSVAVPVPALDLLTYRVPEGIDTPPVGSRVLVPLGARRLTGIVAAIGIAGDAQGEPAGLKDLADVLDASPFLPPGVVELGTWVGDYYTCGPGEALGAAMPPFAWVESEWRVRITDAGRMRATRVGPAGRRTLRESLLSALEEIGRAHV